MGDFTKDGGGKGFFGVGGEAEVGRSKNLDAAEAGSELSHEEWVVGAAAADDKLTNASTGAGKYMAMDGVHNREGREDRGGADEVCGTGTMRTAPFEDASDVG